MRERLTISILAALALAACSVNYPDPAPAEPLVFSAVASHSTKSIITTTNYPLDEPFAVEAVHYTNEKDSEGTVFMHQEKVSYDFNEGYWKTKSDYFWPESGQIRFYAGSPIIPEVTYCPEHGVEADWTINPDDETIIDLCYAEVTESCVSHSAAVPVVFSHALSQICFKAKTLKHYSFSQTANNKIQANIITTVLDSVKILGLLSKGHFTQIPRGWTHDKSVLSDYVIYRNEEGLELNCDRYENPILMPLRTMLMLPQDIPADAILQEWHHMVVRTSITNAATGQIESDMTYSVPRSSEIHLNKLCEKWMMDFKYTFHLAVGQEDSELAVAVTDWTETKEIILGDR